MMFVSCVHNCVCECGWVCLRGGGGGDVGGDHADMQSEHNLSSMCYTDEAHCDVPLLWRDKSNFYRDLWSTVD